MAASTIWITVASLIAAFDIKKSNKCGGLDHGYDPGILRYDKKINPCLVQNEF